MRQRTGAGIVVLALLIAAALPAAAQATGSISGTLTDASGEPAAYVPVVAFTDTLGTVSMALTWDDGTYELHGLAAGDYHVGAGNGLEMEVSEYAQVWWPGVADVRDAGSITVTDGEAVAGIDLTMELGGIVTGTLTHAWTGEPMADTWVNLDEWWFGQWSGSTGNRTEGDGTFRIPGLSGTYRLSVWENGFLALESDSFAIGPGEALTMDLVLTPEHGSPYGTVGGMVCETTTTVGCAWEAGGFAGVTIEARGTDAALLGATTSDQGGWFELSDLTPGTITLSAVPPPGFELADSVVLEIGPDESVWGAELLLRRITVSHSLSAWIEPPEISPGRTADLHLELAVAAIDESLEPFSVTNMEVHLRLPPGMTYLAHEGDGPFDPETGVWGVPRLDFTRRARLAITVSAEGEGRFSPHAELSRSDWPDEVAVFGDGRGEDHATATLTVAAPVQEPDPRPEPDPEPAPPVDAAVIAGQVWLDADANGVRDTGEPGLEGVSIVITSDGQTEPTLTTSQDGSFRLAGLPGGTYRVELDASTLPEDIERPRTVYVLALGSDSAFLGADFACDERPVGFRWALAVLALGVAGVATYGGWLLVQWRRPSAP